MRTYFFAGLAILVLLACETPPDPADGSLPDGGAALDAGPIDPPQCEGLPTLPSPTCAPLDTDYAPGADDMWEACISDNGAYNRVLDDISTVARVAAYEELRGALFDPTRDPSSEEFLAGRLIYQREQGLDSRVVRRFDPWFEVPDGTDCTAEGVPALFPDHCVGPALLQPVILDAFEQGIRGAPRSRVQAARIEASLLWFFYASTAKEAFTCTRTAKDCDSAYAYYTGGEPARGGIGLAADVARTAPEAHDRAWDGILALRCWRDLDDAEVATDTVLRDRARAQLDRAVTQGVAMLVRARLVQACETEGETLLYHWTFARTLAPALQRAALERDPAQAGALTDALLPERPGAGDATRAIEALDALFDCP
ncbi:MAG: hypothetical protein AB8I08_04320 [Sandaracinaceae bacterium]